METQTYCKSGKNHNTAETSRESFIELKRSRKLNRQHALVFTAISEHQPVTSRQLIKLTGLERGALTRVLFNATHTEDPLIKICYDAPCDITGRAVHWYSLIEWQPTEAEHQAANESYMRQVLNEENDAEIKRD